jgi:hypothetical protein
MKILGAVISSPVDSTLSTRLSMNVTWSVQKEEKEEKEEENRVSRAVIVFPPSGLSSVV